MTFNKQHTAYVNNLGGTNFTLSIPSLFSMPKTERMDLLVMLKEHKGHWNSQAKYWVFGEDSRISLFNTLKFYDVDMKKQYLSAPTTRVPVNTVYVPSSEGKQIVTRPRHGIQVQVPRKIIIPKKSALITDVLTLQKEFLKLHSNTGMGKTNMIKILRAAVPALIQQKKVKK